MGNNVDFLIFHDIYYVENITNMKENRDNIYIYIWEELNTVYIGRTVNPKGRHYQHKHRESEKTYQFSSENHVEHPKMTILENDLSLEDGIEHEKYWIDYYRNNSSYNVLNKSKGGQIGGQLRPLALTETEKKERRRLYRKAYYENHKDKNEFKENNKIYYEKYKKDNKEKIREKSKKYYETHREEIKEYRKLNKNRTKEYMKKYWIEHREEKKEVDRKRYELHKKEKNEYTKKYIKEHKEKILELKRKYREKHREELRLKAKEYREKKKKQTI